MNSVLFTVTWKNEDIVFLVYPLWGRLWWSSVMCVRVYTCALVCGGQRSALGIVFSPLKFLRRGLSLNLELTDSARLAGQ